VSEPVIALDHVNLKLGSAASQVQVLKNVSLSVPKGEAVGIVGPSGSGKTTLLMVLAGLERPDSGSVAVAGARLDQMSEDAIARFRGRNIGFVFQSFHLIANMTALENVAVPLELAGADDAFDRARAELEAVGLKDRMTHYPGQLSGGEQQRVAIARALAPEPAILIADEPTGNLDQDTGRQIADLIFDTQKKRGTSFVLVTHDAALAERCDRQVRVRSGEVFAGDAAAKVAAE
jgi:putative ABC transport system ATP-binding protein